MRKKHVRLTGHTGQNKRPPVGNICACWVVGRRRGGGRLLSTFMVLPVRLTAVSTSGWGLFIVFSVSRLRTWIRILDTYICRPQYRFLFLFLRGGYVVAHTLSMGPAQIRLGGGR